MEFGPIEKSRSRSIFARQRRRRRLRGRLDSTKRRKRVCLLLVQLPTVYARVFKAITNKAAFITGTTSVFVPELPHLSVMLPSYNRYKLEIGHEAVVDIIHNEVLDAYIVFGKRVKPASYYRTLFSITPIDRRAKVRFFLSKIVQKAKSENYSRLQFYVDLYVYDHVRGIYKHPHFGLIADPDGYLDIARLIPNLDISMQRFEVPIIDLLGGVHETRQVSKNKFIVARE